MFQDNNCILVSTLSLMSIRSDNTLLTGYFDDASIFDTYFRNDQNIYKQKLTVTSSKVSKQVSHSAIQLRFFHRIRRRSRDLLLLRRRRRPRRSFVRFTSLHSRAGTMISELIRLNARSSLEPRSNLITIARRV